MKSKLSQIVDYIGYEITLKEKSGFPLKNDIAALHL